MNVAYASQGARRKVRGGRQVRPEAAMTNIVVRRADFSDIEAGVAFGRELNQGCGVDWFPASDDRIKRLAHSWLTSKDHIVLVAEIADQDEDTFPASLAE